MKLYIVISGDSHYDLVTDGIDRTDDIDYAKNQIIDYAIGLKRTGKEVLFLDMGDIFHGTRPRASAIAKVIRTYWRLEENEISTIIIAGNHDVIDQKGETSALEPIIAVDYVHINIYHHITLINRYGNLNIIALPHISKSYAVSEGFKSVQDYIETTSATFEEDLPKDDINLVIGHLNIAGAMTGTESYMIKGAHEEFPAALKNSPKINYIFNGHIHRMQRIENAYAPIIITGDIQTNDFGERLDRKCFYCLEVNVNG